MRPQLTAAQQDLALAYWPMARSLARPFKRQFPMIWEEFESAACLALVEAARSFEPERAVKFATFARRRIWGGLRDVLRRWAAEGVATVPLDAWHAATLAAEAPPVGSALERTEDLECWLGQLPARHAEVCRRIYRDGLTHAETARTLGLSASRITYVHRQALQFLRDGRRLSRKPEYREAETR